MTDNDKTTVSETPEPAAEIHGDPTPVAPQIDQDPPKKIAVPPPQRRSGAPWFVLLLLVIAAAAAGGYWMWQQLQVRDAKLEELQARVTENNGQLTDLQSRVQTQVDRQLADTQARAEAREQEWRQQFDQFQRDQEQLRQQLDGQQQRLASLSTTSREDWLLAEAEYLLNIANQRVLMERTTENAVALLRSADERLQQAGEGSGDAELFAIRKALNRDLTALEQIDPVDKEGLYLRLYALAERVDELPRLQVEEFGVNAETDRGEAVEDGAEPGWAARLWRGVRDLAGSLDRYVRIDDVEAPAKPLVDSYATRLAALNVRLLLEQAQLALLQEETTVYRHSLEKALELLRGYYIASEQNERLQASINELLQLEVAPELPDISESLTLLRDYLRQLHRVEPAPKGQL